MASQEEYYRLLGARDGLVSALICIGSLKGGLIGPGGAYLPPKRHTRKRAAIEAKVRELQHASYAIQRQLDDVKSALAKLEPTS